MCVVGALRLPGSHLEDCGAQRELFDKVLAAEDMRAEEFNIEGVPGFALKGEDRPLIVTPAHLRVRPAEEDPLNRGTRMVRLRFELGRGSYATLVVKRLFEAVGEERCALNNDREDGGRARVLGDDVVVPDLLDEGARSAHGAALLCCGCGGGDRVPAAARVGRLDVAAPRWYRRTPGPPGGRPAARASR